MEYKKIFAVVATDEPTIYLTSESVARRYVLFLKKEKKRSDAKYFRYDKKQKKYLDTRSRYPSKKRKPYDPSKFTRQEIAADKNLLNKQK